MDHKASEVREITPPMRIPDTEIIKLTRAKTVLIVLSALLVIGTFALFLFLNKNQSQSPTTRVCSQEAKACPDGNFVTRTGPNCEFSPCPSPKPSKNESMPTWTKYQTGKVSFEYPSDYKLEETNKGFITLTPKSSEEAPITIDTRTLGSNAIYENAIQQTKDSLNNETEKTTTNGVKIYGNLNENLGGGKFVLRAFIKFGVGSITLDSSGETLDEMVFDQILASVKIN